VAATVMELLPPVGWADVARQRDLDQLEARLGERFASIDHRFDSVERQLAQTNRFIGLMVASNAALAAVVTLVVTLAR
jgi:hypothetical protein